MGSQKKFLNNSLKDNKPTTLYATTITKFINPLPKPFLPPPHSHSTPLSANSGDTLPHSHSIPSSTSSGDTLSHSHSTSLSANSGDTLPHSHSIPLSTNSGDTLPHSHSISLSANSGDTLPHSHSTPLSASSGDTLPHSHSIHSSTSFGNTLPHSHSTPLSASSGDTLPHSHSIHSSTSFGDTLPHSHSTPLSANPGDTLPHSHSTPLSANSSNTLPHSHSIHSSTSFGDTPSHSHSTPLLASSSNTLPHSHSIHSSTSFGDTLPHIHSIPSSASFGDTLPHSHNIHSSANFSDTLPYSKSPATSYDSRSEDSNYIPSDLDSDNEIPDPTPYNPYNNNFFNLNNFNSSSNKNNHYYLSAISRNEHSNEHLVIPITLSYNGISIDTIAMIDSGATSSFIDRNLVKSYSIPNKQKKTPNILRVIDGRDISSGAITHHTHNLYLTYMNHKEYIKLDITKLIDYPIILGITWLRQHNPSIQWPNNSVLIPNKTIIPTPDKKQTICTLYSQLPPTSNSNSPIDTIMIPPEYSDFTDVFSKKAAEQLPPHRTYDHRIPLLPDKDPPFGPIYALSELELTELRKNLDENLERKFIQPSSSPAGAPILFVKKKNEELRLVVDYRGLNKVTVKNKYPLPLINELLDRFRTAKYFTKIDLRGAYNLIRIAEGEEWKTAFRTRYGHFEYRVMPFGLCNAPASFQHLMNEVLSDCLDHFTVAYLDDILIFSPTLKEHITHVREVLTRLRKHSLYAKLEKCEFHKSKVEFLGYIISSQGITMDKTKTEAIQTWPTPCNIKDIQSFIGFANFYHRFIQDFSKIVTPLTKLTRKDTPWNWSETTQTSFETLKNAFITAPILQYFDPNKPITVEADASDYAIGAVLSQPDKDNHLHPIAFYSHKFQPAEINYEIYDKEMFAIVAAFREWRAYLEGAQHTITVITDHKNLEYFITTKVLNCCQACWAEILGNYNFVIKYIPGKANVNLMPYLDRPDYHPKGGDGIQNTLTMLKPHQLILAATATDALNPNLSTEIKKLYKQDIFTANLLPYLKKKNLEIPNNLKNTINKFEFKDNLILFKNLIYIPNNDKLKIKILKLFHDAPMAGHFGRTKTIELITRNYTWPKLKSFVTNYILTCNQCNYCKTNRHKPYGLLQPLPIPSGPWKSISMDFIVSLPKSNNHNAILVIVDCLTKAAHFIPTTNKINTFNTAKLFLNNIYKLHGLPNNIISDRGSIFTSSMWTELMKLLNIKLNLSTAFHPQSDGQTECVNQVLEQYLRIYCDYTQDNWYNLLPLAEFAYNNSQHTTTKISPFYANKGYHPIAIPTIKMNQNCKNPSAETMATELQKIHKTLSININEANKRSTIYYNKKHLDPPEIQ